jgi:hypothetical protein
MRTYELNTQVDTLNSVNPYQCAALLDADGREIPITEEMIMRACDELMERWHFPQKAA